MNTTTDAAHIMQPEPASAMRILMVVDGNFPGRTGGAELQAGLLGREFAARGHRVEFVAPRVSSSQLEHEMLWGLPVWRIPYPQLRIIGTMIMLTRFAWWLLRHRQTYDVIHVHMVRNMATIAGMLRPCLRATLMMKISGAWEFQGGILDAQLQHRLIYRFMRYCVRRADYMQCISEFTRKKLRELDFPDRAIAMIPNAINLNIYTGKNKHTARKHRTVVFVGRLEPVKGLDVLLHAWQAVHKSVKNVQLIIAGTGDQQDELVQLSHDLGIDQYVHFPGHVDDVAALLETAELYVQPSYQEGLSNSLMQAMAMSLPVVATRISGNEDLVTDRVSGRLVEPGNPAELALALREILENPEDAVNMGRRARQQIEERYQVDAVIGQLLQAYRARL
jgi:glycosyltransferase involved in cell wall biosynthesis